MISYLIYRHSILTRGGVPALLLAAFVAFSHTCCANSENPMTDNAADNGSSEGLRITQVSSPEPAANVDDLPWNTVTELCEGQQRFACELYRQVRDLEGNLFFSPHSISVALGMTYAGARDETAKQMQQTLHYLAPPERTHQAFNRLRHHLEPDERQKFELAIANRIWGDQGQAFLTEFLSTLAQHYDADLGLLDFRHQPEPSRRTINAWIAKQTNDRITDLLPAGSIDSMTRLVLTNAIYFKASWASQFDEEHTKSEPFHLLDDEEVAVPMMRQMSHFAHHGDEQLVALELPYVSNSQSMVVIMPAEGRFRELERNLTPERLERIMAQLQHKQVDLTFPKFESRSRFSLAGTLGQLGMPLAFTKKADFTGMTGDRSLQISDVYHQAFVRVDETGTEAAAATGVAMAATAMPSKPVAVVVDRPFVYVIRDRKSGAFLFMGRLLDPR